MSVDLKEDLIYQHLLKNGEMSFAQLHEVFSGIDESELDDLLFELAYNGKVYQSRPDFYKAV